MSESPPIDATLDDVLRGNPDAFLLIVRAHGPSLRAYLASQIFHLDDVDDVAQETFIAAYRSLHTFRRGSDFGAWLRGIARHKLLRYFEQHGRHTEAMEGFRRESSAHLQTELEDAASRTTSEHLQAMLVCIGKLPERMRQVVRTWLEGGRSASLAEELQTTPAAVYQLQYRALKVLRECIGKEVAHGN